MAKGRAEGPARASGTRKAKTPRSLPTDMERREAPPTREGWYALHDFRRVDWDAWREAPEREREQAIEEGREYAEAVEGLADADEGASVTYAVLGHDADLLFVHLRPTMEAVDALARRFEGTALAGFTERASSYVSVTEVSGYTTDAQGYFERGEDGEFGEVEDQGLANYLDMRLHPTIPDAEHVCFYPMSKRRGPDHNWYDLPFEERAEHMSAHGEIGREYAGKVTQVITSSIGFDDWEWGVTLFSNDASQFKRLLYEMRFDPSTSRFAEFGPFFTGTRLDAGSLGRYLQGETLGEAGADEDAGPHAHGESAGESPHGEGSRHGGRSGHGGHGEGESGGGDGGEDGDIRGQLADMDIYAGKPHGEDVYAIVLYSEADPDALFEEVEGLRNNFDHYDTHVKTAVYADEGERPAVVSLWETQSAAQTAGGFLADLPSVVGRAGEEAGWGTMGMFYTVKPEHREDFVEKFETVGGVLADTEGHRETRLLANLEDENDMFIDSRWVSREDAMGFFRSDAFADTVSWGRDVLADRPRHVFLA